MLEQIIKEEIETLIRKKGLDNIIKDIVREKMSDENIQQTIENEIDKLLPEAVRESVKYQLEDSDIIHNAVYRKMKENAVYRKMKEMVENRILNWR